MLQHFILLSTLGISFSAQAREFTNTSGKTIEAELVQIKGRNAGLRLKSGKVVYYPINKLSSADKAYLKQQFNSNPSIKLPLAITGPLPAFRHEFKGKETFLDQQGKVISAKQGKKMISSYRKIAFPSLRSFKDPVSKLYGFKDSNKKVVIKAQFQSAETSLAENRALVILPLPPHNPNKRPPKSLVHLIDKSGKSVVNLPRGYHCRFNNQFNSGLLLIDDRESGGQYYINSKGEIAIPSKTVGTENLRNFSEGYAVVKGGIIRSNGKWSIKPESQWIIKGHTVTDGVIIAQKKDKEGEFIVSAEDGSELGQVPKGLTAIGRDKIKISGKSKYGLFVVAGEKAPHKMGIMDRSGKLIAPAKYSRIMSYIPGFFSATDKSNGGYANVVLNARGKIIHMRGVRRNNERYNTHPEMALKNDKIIDLPK